MVGIIKMINNIKMSIKIFKKIKKIATKYKKVGKNKLDYLFLNDCNI